VNSPLKAATSRGSEGRGKAEAEEAEAGKGKLFGVQVVRAVHLEPIESIIANELVTSTFTPKRRKFTEKYRAVIEDLYTQV
jgi:hypothetical protein